MSSTPQTTNKNNSTTQSSKHLNNSHHNKFKYKRKWYYKDEWSIKCKNDKLFNNFILGNNIVPSIHINKSKSSFVVDSLDTNNNNNNTILVPEPSLPLLLLNYFIIYGYEEAAIRMCKELNLIQNNNDIKLFNDLFMIKERNKIKILILSGKITDAINLIDNSFGLNILYENNNNTSHDNDDLYFQLVLLNLIEMIRNNSFSNDISKLVQYARIHLSTKASQSKRHMTDLQSVISLLMLTAAARNNNNESIPLNINNLPNSLKMLYSIKLRNKLAHSINMKFLQVINVRVSNQKKFPNLVLSDNLPPSVNNHPQQKLNNTNGDDTPIEMDSNVSELSVTDHNRYWQETKKYLHLQFNLTTGTSNTSSGPYNNVDTMVWRDFPFEAKLVQLMKLWIYSENRLHRKGFGVPRVEDNLKSSSQ